MSAARKLLEAFIEMGHEINLKDGREFAREQGFHHADPSGTLLGLLGSIAGHFVERGVEPVAIGSMVAVLALNGRQVLDNAGIVRAPPFWVCECGHVNHFDEGTTTALSPHEEWGSCKDCGKQP